MRNLLEFLAKHNHWILFAVLEAIGLVLLFQYNSYQRSVWFSSANAVAGKVYEWDSQVMSYFSLATVNEQLTQRNVYLEQQVRNLSEKLGTATHDSIAVQESVSQSLKGFRLIPAKVIANSVDKEGYLLTIDKGSADGIRKDMGVVSGNGVVGIVYLVSTHYAVIIPVLNSHSNISCTIKNRGYFGYLHWNGGYKHMAYVDDIPRHAHFKIGDYVTTSGYSSVFPEGVMVGQIKYVFNSPDGLSYRVKVKLATDFGNLRNVCVVDNSLLQERIDIMRAARDSIQPKDK